MLHPADSDLVRNTPFEQVPIPLRRNSINTVFCYSINHHDDYILEETDLPDELIRDVSGTNVFQQTMSRVCTVQSE